MSVLQAFRESPAALARTPSLIVPVFVLTAVQLPQFVLQSSYPIAAGIVSLALSVVMLVAIPFFQGGIVAMANETLDGPSSLGTFLAAGKANYWDLLVAYLILFVVNLAIGALLVFALLVAGIGWVAIVPAGGGGAAGGLSGGLGALGIVAIIVALVAAFVALAAFVGYLLLNVALQFYAHAIVIDDLTAIAGLKRSAARVRHNLIRVLGYIVLAVLVGGIVGVFISVLSLLASPEPAAILGLPTLSTPLLALVAVVITVLASVLGAFLAVFSVAVYRRLPLPESAIATEPRSVTGTRGESAASGGQIDADSVNE